MADGKLDPVRLGLIWQRLNGIVDSLEEKLAHPTATLPELVDGVVLPEVERQLRPDRERDTWFSPMPLLHWVYLSLFGEKYQYEVQQGAAAASAAAPAFRSASPSGRRLCPRKCWAKASGSSRRWRTSSR